MKDSVKIKNIAILIFTYLLGFLSSLFFTYYEEIDLKQIYLLLNRETTIGEPIQIEEVPRKEETDGSIIEEVEVEEIDKCAVLADISGAIKNPGVYCFEAGSTVVDGVKKAGGFLTSAGFKYISMKINLSKPLLDNSKIYIPFQSDLHCEVVKFELPKEVEQIIEPPNENPPNNGGNSEEECININTASKENLMELNGVGEATAQKIIDARPFNAIEDILNVSGIGTATFEKFKDDICI